MNNYFNIITQQIDASSAEFVVELVADCPVYQGHFPGNPIAPGACNIEMIRQCASLALHRDVRIQAMKVCKFMMMLRPEQPQYLTIQLTWDGNKTTALVLAEQQTAIQLKMTLL